jgi:predicted NUDIX family NTP pyrophosphohydrolase
MVLRSHRIRKRPVAPGDLRLAAGHPGGPAWSHRDGDGLGGVPRAAGLPALVSEWNPEVPLA